MENRKVVLTHVSIGRFHRRHEVFRPKQDHCSFESQSRIVCTNKNVHLPHSHVMSVNLTELLKAFRKDAFQFDESIVITD